MKKLNYLRPCHLFDGNRYFYFTRVKKNTIIIRMFVISLMDKLFTNKVVTRHTADKPWVTDYFRCLIRKRQRAFMRGDKCEYKVLRNEVNNASAVLNLGVVTPMGVV